MVSRTLITGACQTPRAGAAFFQLEKIMSAITVEIPGELEKQLRPMADRLPQILELGLRELQACGQPQFTGAVEVLEFLARLPGPKEVLALRPAAALEARVAALLEKSREHGLTPAEAQEWSRFEFLEHLVRLAKAQAALRVAAA